MSMEQDVIKGHFEVKNNNAESKISAVTMNKLNLDFSVNEHNVDEIEKKDIVELT